MRLEATIALFAEDPSALPKDTGRWRRFKRLFDKHEPEPEAPAVGLDTRLLVHGARLALARLGVSNAVSLEVDGQVLFEDREHQSDDLDALFGSYDAASARWPVARLLTGGDDGRAKELELVVEHREGATHVEIRLVNHVAASAGAPDAEVSIVGHPVELERVPDEDLKTQRARIDRLMASPGFIETRRLEFESLVERVQLALSEALPGVRASASDITVRDVAPGKSRRPKEPGGLAAGPVDELLDAPAWAAESLDAEDDWVSSAE